MEANGKIIELIQKCLALSKSSNEHEATLALRKAQELLEKYNLSMRDIPAEEGQVSVQMQNLKVPVDSKNWKRSLIHCIALNNFCTTILSGQTMHILGREPNVQSTLIMSNWIIEQLDKIAWVETYCYMGPVPKIKFKNSLLWGAVDKINQRLKEARQERTQADSNLYSLVVNLDQETNAFKNRQFPKTHQVRLNHQYDREAYRLGQQEAGKIGLYGSNRQVEGAYLLD